MNSDLDATVTVEVVLRGRRATIEDIQQVLDTLHLIVSVLCCRTN